MFVSVRIILPSVLMVFFLLVPVPCLVAGADLRAIPAVPCTIKIDSARVTPSRTVRVTESKLEL